MLPMARPSPSYSGTKELVALGTAIREIRIDLGLSQEALANEVGIDRSYMGGIERGEHNLALINLIRVASTLNLSAAELLKKAGL
jgi:transcriptional regulator with XRE-family HTH domain